MLAAGNGLPVYLSTNAGIRWSQTDTGSNNWAGVACSADGQRLVAVQEPGRIFVSSNGGTSWYPTGARSNNWTAVTSTADGRQLVATSSSWSSTETNGGISISPDGGDSWHQTAAPSGLWYAVASSADGTRLAAAGDARYGGHMIYTSKDSGLTWSSNAWTSTDCHSVACSADGGKLFAAGYRNGIYAMQSLSQPALSLTTSGGGLQLSWLIPSTQFFLEQTSDLTATQWLSVGAAPALDYNQLHNRVILPLPSRPTFYRLRSQ